ncbi:hypothetical protein [Myxococcus qinghaiensis]|uniref:hypothetical protein n=1 Tax=Myxococcus qinghaiensis TaxID=2906758 RepID=UPI0020A72222|nr:hypothetical protein [Myxococcus qinghaiensis]MCP3163099.1 hypothetical protein [Myxococcus qinghaiensis]
MTKNILNAAMVLVGAAGLLTGCNFDQPEAPCFVQDATNWSAVYDSIDDPKDGTGAACEIKAPPTELLGVYKFVDPDDLSRADITIRPQGLASRASRDPGPTTDQTATGAFDVEPDDKGFCTGRDFTDATVVAAAAGTTAATTITYQFTEVQVYAAPSLPGTQLKGELKYTRDGCTSTYAIRAIWPGVLCYPTGDAEGPAELCGEGSGLNPDFAAECGPVVGVNLGREYGYCIPSKAIPSLK